MGKKLAIFAVIIVVAGGFIYFLSGGINQPASPTTENGEESTLPAATGNVDDTVATILQDAESDEISAAETDPSLVEMDQQALNDFGQSFDASGL